MERTTPRPWMYYALLAAATYNILWGLAAALSPAFAAQWSPVPLPRYPELWHALGFLVAVFGVGFALAAVDPLERWPVILMGLLGKVVGPFTFVEAALRNRLPWHMAWRVAGSDLIWWFPLGTILAAAYRAQQQVKRTSSPEVQRMALRCRTQWGETLLDMSSQAPLMLVFLRHAGCPFCREALADLAAQRQKIEAGGTRVVLIHMSKEDYAARFFARYGLGDLPRVSDPKQNFYRAFGLQRGTLMQLFGPANWWRLIEAGVRGGHGAGTPQSDVFQMPGLFLIFHGEVLRSHQHQVCSERPNYARFAKAASF